MAERNICTGISSTDSSDRSGQSERKESKQIARILRRARLNSSAHSGPSPRAQRDYTMRYRLPLELELTILEFAAPPLAIDSLHDRVEFFNKISLVHRSLTAWAQDRLRDQLLYTYRRRPDEYERLKARFEAGFGRDRPLRRLYLDLSRLPSDVDCRKECGSDSVSATIDGRVYGPVSSTSGPGGPEQVGSKAQEQACEAVAHYVQPASDSNGGRWELCTMITSYSQALDTL